MSEKHKQIRILIFSAFKLFNSAAKKFASKEAIESKESVEEHSKFKSRNTHEND